MQTAAADTPLRFPGFLLKAFVNGLRYRGLHEVDVSYNVWRKHVTEVIVKPTAAQAFCKETHFPSKILKKQPNIWSSCNTNSMCDFMHADSAYIPDL